MHLVEESACREMVRTTLQHSVRREEIVCYARTLLCRFVLHGGATTSCNKTRPVFVPGPVHPLSIES